MYTNDLLTFDEYIVDYVKEDIKSKALNSSLKTMLNMVRFKWLYPKSLFLTPFTWVDIKLAKDFVEITWQKSSLFYPIWSNPFTKDH